MGHHKQLIAYHNGMKNIDYCLQVFQFYLIDSLVPPAHVDVIVVTVETTEIPRPTLRDELLCFSMDDAWSLTD